jgi:predicted nucleic acid-binding protein
MNCYPDTSFLCALYRPQSNSEGAARFFGSMKGPLSVSSVLLFEFRQSLRLQAFLHSKDRTKGFSNRESLAVLEALERNLSEGFLRVVPLDLADVMNRAEYLSSRHTRREGARGFDILHVASALHLGVAEFLTYDLGQKRMALAESLIVPF